MPFGREVAVRAADGNRWHNPAAVVTYRRHACAPTLRAVDTNQLTASATTYANDLRHPGTSALDVYRDGLLWPVHRDADGIWLALGVEVSAVELPARRGWDVAVILRRDWERSGPVLAAPTSQGLRWVFLTRPDEPGAAVASAVMVGARVRATPPDAVPLPPSLTPRGPVSWIVAPALDEMQLPRLRSVLAAAWQTATV